MIPYKYNKEKDTIYWYISHAAYHITEKKNILRIQKYGLQPRNGPRCKQINDESKGIFFTDNIYGINSWINWLYNEEKIEELVLLKFDVLHRIVHFKDYEDYFLSTKVPPNELAYLSILKKKTKISLKMLLEALYNEKEYQLQWTPLLQYKLENTDK